MSARVNGLSAGLILLLSVTSLGEAGRDLRLVEAVEQGDKEAVRSLLKQHVDVNTPENDGATALTWAAHRDDLETADLLLRAGANVNAANDYGVTPLSLACSNGNGAMVQKLLEAGADANAALTTGETALMTAARTGNEQVVGTLLSAGAHVNAKEDRWGQTALMWAIAENHPEVAQVLIQHGANIHARSKGGFTPLLFAAQQGNTESGRMLLAAGANVNEATPQDGNALVVASASGHESFSMFLLDHGADPNSVDGYGITALHYALRRGIALLGGARFDSVLAYLFRPDMLELVKALLAHGADPNARIAKSPPVPHSRPIVTSPVGATPFLLAAAAYDASSMRMLAASGADPSAATEENTTPLIMAAGLGEGLNLHLPPRTQQDDSKALEAVKLAVELGADVNAANDTGFTALHAAAFVGSDAIVQFLADKGAKLDAQDKYGQTALSIAEKIIPPRLTDAYSRPHEAHKSTADLLRKLGATPIAASGERASNVPTVNPNQQ